MTIVEFVVIILTPIICFIGILNNFIVVHIVFSKWSPEQGAAPVTRLASDPALDGGDGVPGRYFRRFGGTAPSAAGSDDAAAARLWEYAAKETGLSA